MKTVEWTSRDAASRKDLPPDLTTTMRAGQVRAARCDTRGGPGGAFVCTRRPDHTGRHAAGTGFLIVAVWS